MIIGVTIDFLGFGFPFPTNTSTSASGETRKREDAGLASNIKNISRQLRLDLVARHCLEQSLVGSGFLVRVVHDFSVGFEFGPATATRLCESPRSLEPGFVPSGMWILE